MKQIKKAKADPPWSRTFLKKAIPDIPIAALSASLINDNNGCPLLPECIAIHQSISYINKAFVDSAHKQNLKVNVFTVNHHNDLNDLLNLGIDGIFTDCLFPSLSSQE